MLTHHPCLIHSDGRVELVNPAIHDSLQLREFSDVPSEGDELRWNGSVWTKTHDRQILPFGNQQQSSGASLDMRTSGFALNTTQANQGYVAHRSGVIVGMSWNVEVTITASLDLQLIAYKDGSAIVSIITGAIAAPGQVKVSQTYARSVGHTFDAGDILGMTRSIRAGSGTTRNTSAYIEVEFD